MSNETIELSSLDSFYEDDLIVDVLDIIKRGKEAAVYRCQAHPSTGMELLAAKVYHAREIRSFKNDAIYQQGRVILDRRLRRAVRKKSRTGREVQSGSWIEHEFQALSLLHAGGADVPRPLKRSGPAILMEYVGDHESSAPMLRSTRMTPGTLLRKLRSCSTAM
jgi:RIO kinase 1